MALDRSPNPIEIVRAITKTSILTKSDDNLFKNVTAKALTRFFRIWAV
jgi:hypothetical protein